MKDLLVIWNTLSRRQIYSSVNTNPNGDKLVEQDETRTLKSLQRKSSVVVNKFFNAALPVHSDGRRRWSKNIFMLMSFGLLSLICGCFILLCHPYELIVKWKMVFGEGGETFELWRKPEVDLYLKVYLFNVTNRDEYLSGEESKLRFQEVGPYVYKELFEHANVAFNDNGTLSTIPVHPLMYIPEISNGTEDDLVIMPNIALFNVSLHYARYPRLREIFIREMHKYILEKPVAFALRGQAATRSQENTFGAKRCKLTLSIITSEKKSITNLIKDASYVTRWGLNTLIRSTNTQPLVQMTAHEFMFGYESTLVTLGNKLLPSWIKFDKLGLIDRMYDFDGDFETIYTGETDVRLTGLIDKYNGDVNLPQWTGKCANVQGASDGVKFPSYIQPNDTILFFRKSLCRSERLVRVGGKTIQGLNTYQYKFMENELDNGAVNPENKCFCRKGKCLKSGLIDVTDCYYGFPIALSYPHFYKSDPSLLEAVEGLKPTEELHESYFFIQPKSGIPLDLAARFQINMPLQNIGHMSNVERFSNLTLPLLWFEIGMYKLPKNMNLRFWLYLSVMPIVEEVIKYLAFCFGTMMLVRSIIKILSHQTKNSSSEWLEMERRRRKAQTDKQIDSKVKDTGVYSTLLTSGDQMLIA